MSGIDNVAPAFIGVGDDLRVTAAGGGIEIGVGSDAVGGIEILSGCVIDGAVGMSGVGLLVVRSSSRRSQAVPFLSITERTALVAEPRSVPL